MARTRFATGLVLGLCLPALCQAAEVRAGRLLRFGLMATEKGGVSEWHRVVKVVPISQTRSLALLRRERTFMDRWADPQAVAREAKEKGVVSREGLIRTEEAFLLAFVAPSGKMVASSAVGPEMEGLGGGAHATREGAALVVLEQAGCPYGLFRPDRQEFLCFDWQLAFLKKHRVPLETVHGVVPTLGDASNEVWFFGGIRSTGNGSEASRPPHHGWWDKTTDVWRLRLETGELRPLNLESLKLLRQLQAVAHTGEGERARLSPEGVLILPVDSKLTSLPLAVVLSAEVDRGKEKAAAKKRLFFHAFLGHDGLSRVRQLPFFLSFGDEKPHWDEKKSVLTLPAEAFPWEVRVIPGPNGALALFLNFLYHADRTQAQLARQGKTAEGFGVSGLVLLDRGQARFFDFPELRVTIGKALSTSKLYVVPFQRYLGLWQPGEPVFAARCQEDDAEESCAVSFTLHF
ncbi:MAG: hypothetical protein RMI39_08670 [Thermoanaerobaculum sp.]|nr:hypothetical protein [Thermoanaerobaculum sp.]